MSLTEGKMAALTVKTQDGEDRSFVPVRDRRNKNWHWKLNALHEELFIAESQEVITFAALLGPAACSVYDYLCRRADEETQSCFPSHPTIAFATGQSEPTVIEALAVIGFFGLIHKENREAEEGDPTSNLYFLLPLEMWSIDGGKTEISEALAKRLADRREKLRARKVPYYLRRRFLPGPKTTVEAVKIFNHPPKVALPPPVKNLNQGGKRGLPPLEEASIEQDSSYSASTEVTRAPDAFAAPDVAVDDEDFQSLPPSAGQVIPTATPFNEGTVAHQVETQLLEFAAARGFSLNAEQARAIVASWPAARMDSEDLYLALTDSARCLGFGLDVPVEATSRGDWARQMVQDDEARVRWMLCVWHAFPESTSAYHEKNGHKYTKTQCFISKFKKAQPPVQWLEGEIARLKKQEEDASRLVNKEASAKRQQEFEQMRSALDAPQLERLKELVLERIEEERPGGSKYRWDDKALRAWESEILFDPARREQVLNAPNESVNASPNASQVSAPRDIGALLSGVTSARSMEGAPTPEALGRAFVEAAANNERENPSFDPYGATATPRQMQLELIVKPILRDLNAGLLALDELDERKPSRLTDGEWDDFKDRVMRQAA